VLEHLIRKTRNQMQVTSVVTVENLSSETTAFTLADRIPVSENKEINDKVRSPGGQAGRAGAAALGPGPETQREARVRISYQVEYPPELVLETQRKRAGQPAPSPAAPASYPIEDQIHDLEEKF
jgi:hypothetical protein